LVLVKARVDLGSMQKQSDEVKLKQLSLGSVLPHLQVPTGQVRRQAQVLPIS
jgi:hypothetical protein